MFGVLVRIGQHLEPFHRVQFSKGSLAVKFLHLRGIRLSQVIHIIFEHVELKLRPCFLRVQWRHESALFRAFQVGANPHQGLFPHRGIAHRRNFAGRSIKFLEQHGVIFALELHHTLMLELNHRLRNNAVLMREECPLHGGRLRPFLDRFPCGIHPVLKDARTFSKHRMLEG